MSLLRADDHCVSSPWKIVHVTHEEHCPSFQRVQPISLCGLQVNAADTVGCCSDSHALSPPFLLPVRSPVLLGYVTSSVGFEGLRVAPTPAPGGGDGEDGCSKPIMMVLCLLPETGSGTLM